MWLSNCLHHNRSQALSLQGLHGDAIAELHSALSMHPADAALVTQVTHTTPFIRL
jgi:hypothetical protein